MVRVEPYTRPAISPIQKNTNTPFKQYKEDNLAQDIYVSAKRCTVVGKIVRKLDSESFLLSVTHLGVYEQYVVYPVGKEKDLFELIPSGQVIEIQGRTYMHNDKIAITAVNISVVHPRTQHIPPEVFKSTLPSYERNF